MVGFVTKRRESRELRGGLCLDEDEGNYYFRQLIWAVQFCHDNHVAHRWARRGQAAQRQGGVFTAAAGAVSPRHRRCTRAARLCASLLRPRRAAPRVDPAPRCPRDLKLDNTLLDGHDPPRLKLCDFGFAKGWGANSNMDTMRIGT